MLGIGYSRFHVFASNLPLEVMFANESGLGFFKDLT